MESNSLFKDAPDIVPQLIQPGMSITQLIQTMGNTSFEARYAFRGAELLRHMIDDGDTIWLGIAGAPAEKTIDLSYAPDAVLNASTQLELYDETIQAEPLP